MSKKGKIIVSISGIVLVMLILVGLTYAYFLTRIQGNTNEKSISVTTAYLKLVYNDGSDGVIGGELLKPSDEEFTKTFTVYNDGNVNIDYGVYLIDVINTFERKDDLKYTMECSTNGTLACGQVTSETTFPSGISELVTATIEPKKTHTYTFKFTYKDTGTDQSVDMGKVLKAKIQIFGKNNNGLIIPYETNTLAFNILNNGADISIIDSPGNFIGGMCGMDEAECVANVAAGCPGTCYEKGTETYKVTNTKNIKTTVNIDNIANGTSWDEQLKDYTNDGLFSTEDDYGTSYYYRGPVSNNYVTFSNKCWRIVRIQGDGSIKLTLESQSPCSETMTSDFSIGNTNWGYKTENSKKIGDYKSSTSGMKNLLTTWLNVTDDSGVSTNITESAEKWLKTEEWCLGNTTNTYAYNSPYALLGTTATENYTSGTSFYYETGRNLNGKGVTRNATLKCNGETDTSKIGALTADEVVFAGGKAGSSNINYYLHNSSYNWWTLSRSYFDGTSDRAFSVDSHGALGGDGYVFNFGSNVRPAVSLKSSTQITGGNGTVSNPYTIAD